MLITMEEAQRVLDKSRGTVFSRIAREGQALPAAPSMASTHAQTGSADARAGVAQVTEPVLPAPGGTTDAAMRLL